MKIIKLWVIYWPGQEPDLSGEFPVDLLTGLSTDGEVYKTKEEAEKSIYEMTHLSNDNSMLIKEFDFTIR